MVDERFQRKLRKGLFERDRRLTFDEEERLRVKELSPFDDGVVCIDAKALLSAMIFFCCSDKFRMTYKYERVSIKKCEIIFGIKWRYGVGDNHRKFIIHTNRNRIKCHHHNFSYIIHTENGEIFQGSSKEFLFI